MEENTDNLPVSEPTQLANLRALVAALSGKQKQDFKKSAGFHGTATERLRYVALFDFANSLLVTRAGRKPKDFYPAFRASFFGKKICPSAELSSLCLYLQNRILESVRYQNATAEGRNQLLAQLMDILFLQEKDLFNMAEARLAQAIAGARAAAEWALVLECCAMQRRVLLRKTNRERAKNMESTFRKIHEEEIFALEKLTQLAQLRDQNHESQLALWANKPLNSDAVFSQKMTDFDERPEPSAEEIEDAEAHIFWHNTHSNRMVMTVRQSAEPPDSPANKQRYAVVGRHLREIVLTFKRHPEFARKNPKRFQANLTNYLNHCISQSRPEAELLEFFDDLQVTAAAPVQFLNTVAYIQLALFVHRSQFVEAAKWLENQRFASLLAKHSDWVSVTHQQSLRLFVGIVHFALENFGEAEKWFAKNEAADTSMANVESLAVAETLILLCRHAQGELLGHRYPENLAENLLHRLGKIRKQPLEFDREFCHFLQAVLPLKGDSAAFRKLGEQAFPGLLKLWQKHRTGRTSGLPLAWLAANLEGKKMAEVLPRFLQDGKAN